MGTQSGKTHPREKQRCPAGNSAQVKRAFHAICGRDSRERMKEILTKSNNADMTSPVKNCLTAMKGF
ncbi:hypothetical protein [Paraburkholderia sp. GAS334]|uniref:hypothetical protein n=1 Tax=Paraburkholderia sp. GAS334 TaxID=3035131 RepID=UPI003D1E975C